MNQKIEQALEDAIISVTDKVLYYPCSSYRPKIEYPEYHWNRTLKGRSGKRHNTLYLPIWGRSYTKVAENLIEALTGRNFPLIILDNESQKLLYDVITSNPNYEHIRKLEQRYLENE